MPQAVLSHLVPKAGARWPILEDKYLIGGLQTFATIAERDAAWNDPESRPRFKPGTLALIFGTRELWLYTSVDPSKPEWELYLTNSNTMTHVQETASAEWTVDHTFGSSDFTITVFVGNKVVFPADIVAVSDSQVVVTFATEVAGRCVLSFNR